MKKQSKHNANYRNTLKVNAECIHYKINATAEPKEKISNAAKEIKKTCTYIYLLKFLASRNTL